MTTEIKAQAQEVEEIVVTGKAIKESQMAAIEAKRQAVNVADIISADAIGRFPDVNLSDALGRLPGISIERDQGQARYVSFRGTPKRYTTTAFNGISIPGVENGVQIHLDVFHPDTFLRGAIGRLRSNSWLVRRYGALVWS